MKAIAIITDHSTWCDKCGEYLSAANPGARTSYEVMCLACIERMRDALTVRVEADLARER